MVKSFLAPALAAMLALSASVASAGGPVLVAEEPQVVAEEPATSGAILPLLLVGIALCVALCGGNDEEPVLPR